MATTLNNRIDAALTRARTASSAYRKDLACRLSWVLSQMKALEKLHDQCVDPAVETRDICPHGFEHVAAHMATAKDAWVAMLRSEMQASELKHIAEARYIND